MTACDKNVGWAILNHDIYFMLGEKYLAENEVYFKKLDADPSNETIKLVNSKLNDLNKNGHISNKLYKDLKGIK